MTDKKLRIIGVGLFIGGLLIAYFFAYLPLESAKRHDPEVSLNLKLTYLAPITVLFGLFTATFGQQGRGWIQKETEGKQKLTVIGWIFTLFSIGAGIGLYEWLKSAISAYGYQF